MITNALLDFFREGGYVFMGPLLALSVLSLAAMLERIFFLALQAARTRRLADRLRSAAEPADLASLVSGPEAARTIVGLILREVSAATRKHRSAASLERAIRTSADRHTAVLAKRLWILRAIGHIAPLMGLAGTVAGLAVAFRAIAEIGLSQQSVAKGIAMALNTTIMGLGIALPTLFAEHCLRAWAQSQFHTIKTLLDDIVLRFGEEA